MNVHFRGWKREVKPHIHPVTPVKKLLSGSYRTEGDESQPLNWRTPLQALGKVEDLALTGAFLVEFNFTEEELKNWLKKYVEAEPEAALRLLMKMQAEATIALANKAQS
jgi:hypothetical protein